MSRTMARSGACHLPIDRAMIGPDPPPGPGTGNPPRTIQREPATLKLAYIDGPFSIDWDE